MSKAEQYAQWIVDNADKRGTADFNTVVQAYQEAKGIAVEPTEFEKELAGIKPDTGLTGAFSAGKERLKGDIAALAGRVGIMDTDRAEQYKKEKDIRAERMFTPTEKSFSEAPFLKFRELLGGSLPYAAAPLIVGVGAAALPAAGVAVPVATGIGLAGAGLASLGQFTGSNLSRQMQEDPNLRLADTNLASAAAAAAPQAALDIVSFRMVPGIGKIFGAAGKEITPAMAKEIAEQGILRTTGAYGAGIAKTAGIEGTTEAGQQFLERLQAGLNLTDQQARDEYFDSFIGGAVLGGTLATPGTYIERGRTIRQGAKMEQEEKQQANIDRQKAQQEADLAEKRQLQQTSENLGVKSTLMLPPPDKRLELMEEVDPLIDPLGRFKSTDLSPKEVAEVNKRRIQMGKPRIGKTFSIEDLADVFTVPKNLDPTNPEDQKVIKQIELNKEGVLNRLIASRTGYIAGQDISAENLIFAAQQRKIDTTTQGFKDLLIRATSTDNLDEMSPPQRLAVLQAIEKVKPGDETRILESGLTNAKYYTPDQYNDTVKGLSKEFKEVGDQEYGKSSVLKQIEKYSGLKQEKDQQRLLDQAVKDGFLERSVKPGANGSMIELFKPATEVQPLPGGMDIRKETFKQGEVPEAYELRAGSRVLSTRETQEEASRDAVAFEQNRQAEIVRLEKEVQKLQREVAKRNAELTQMQALGQDQSNEFFIKSANYYGQDQVDNMAIANLRQQQQGFADPVQIAPVGAKPVAKDSYTFYEKDQPQVKFDTEEQAEQYGISRLNDETLQQIIESAASQKQTGRVKRYVSFAQKELNERQSTKADRGITITTKKGEKGGKERLEKIGIYSSEAQENVEKIRQTLLPALKRFGLEKVALRLVDSIENGTADGYYVKQVMAIAMDSKNPMGTLRHESIHALKELGAFTDQEWKVLTNKAKSEWVQKYIKDTGLFDPYKERYQQENGNLSGFDDYIYEEAIAEAFRNFKPGNLPAGMIGNIWVRLNKMFEALRNSFQRLGFQTADDIFSRVEEGKQRPTKVVSSEETKLAIKPDNDYEIVRKAQPRGRTTDQVSYELRRKSDNKLIREFDSKKEAQQMLDVYTLPQEEVFAKYPELKPTEKPARLQFNSKKNDITPLDVREARIYERELENLIKKVGTRIAGMKSEETLADVRKAVKKLQEYTAQGLEGKDWYEKSAKAVFNAFNGNDVLAEKFFQVIAITSANTEVAANFTKAANAWTQFAEGRPIKVGTGTENKKIDALLNFGEDWEGRKTNTFYTNLMEAMEGRDSGRSTIDLHMTRMIFGKDTPTDAQYELAENMVRLLASKLDLAPRQIQAASWVTQKAKTMFNDYRKGGKRKDLTDEELTQFAFERAVADYSYQMNTRVAGLPVTDALREPSKDIKTRVQNITGEVIPSVQTNMSQAEELAFADKERLTKDIANEGTVQLIADFLGVTSKIRVTVGSGAYADKVNPNLIVQIVNDDATVAEKDAKDLADAMSYVFKQDATPLFRADEKLLETDQLGFRLKFDTKTITPTQQKKMLAIFQNKFGEDAGFTRLRGNELVMINYRDEDGNPFLTSDKKFVDGLTEVTEALNEISTIESQEFFGAKSEYNYHDWKDEPSGIRIIERIQAGRSERPNIQGGLDDLRESFTDSVRTAVKKSGREPRFSFRRFEPTEPAERPSTVGGGIVLGNKQPDSSSFEGIHYSNAEQTTLNGNRYGGGIKGAEAFRLSQTDDPRIKKRVYFYIENVETGRMQPKEAGLGNYVHKQKFDNILAPSDRMTEIYRLANKDFNQFESAVIDAGYDGYAVPDMGMMVILNHNTPINYEGTVQELAEKGIKYSIRAPETKEFKQWFGNSKIVNEDGSPKVMYHGTTKDFNEFIIAQKVNRAGMPDGFYFTSNVDEANNYASKNDGANIMPVYLNVKNPFDLSKKNKITNEMVMQFRDELRKENPNLPFEWIKEKVSLFKEKAERGGFPFPNITFSTGAMKRVFEVGGYDGLLDGDRHVVAFEPNQIKSATGNIGTFDPANPDIRYSLRSQLSDRLNERIGATTTKRKEAGFVERLIDAMSPTAVTKLRQAFVNKYESIEQLSRLRGEKMGGNQLLAENSAIAAALQSDRAAGVAASSFRDGIPVFDKGYTYVTDKMGDEKVKGLIPILEPLMKYKDPYIFQTFQYYAGTRRGRRLDAEGREKTFTKEDIAYGKELEVQFPEFATVFDEYQKYNQGLVKYMMDTGVISPEEAKIWTQNWDYIPFYRQIDGEKTAGPKVFSPIAGVAKPKKLKGSEAPLDDFMETIVRNARAAIEAGMKNEAARRVVRDVVDFGLGEKLSGVESGNDIVTVKERGQTVYYRVADPLLVESLKGLNLPQLPFMSFLSAPADLLRNFVTKDPGFILANLGRDSMQAWITSGTNMTPLVDTFKQFGKGLLSHSPEAYALAKAGLTGYDFAGDVESTAKKVEQELRKRTGNRTRKEVALLPITAFWDKLGEASTASDMATRAEVYKRTLERTGSEAEAFYQAMEVINFSRKGNSAIIRILSATIPFLNARIQGLDVLYRTGFGKAAMENKEKIQKAFIFRSMVLLGTSVMYWAMVSDDEDYKRLSEEERDNYWIIPGLRVGDKPFRFPIPFELGVLFKVLPERVLEYSFGTDTGKDLRKSLTRNAMSTLSFNPIPQAVLPLVENVTNYSFFTGESVVGRSVEGLAPKFQYGAGTSELAKQMGESLNYSPQKIDNFIRGYTGTLGTYAMMMLDSAMAQEGDPPRASKRMEQLPIIKRFFASNTGTVSAYYDMKEEVDTVVTTVNMLQRTGNAEDLKAYLEENKNLYGLKNYVNTLDKNMKQLNQATRLINSSKTMSSDEKREALDKINDAKIKLTDRVKLLRKNYE